MSRARIHVINPNSNQIVTDGLAEALKPLIFAEGRVSTSLSGTAYIHVARVMASHKHRAAMFGVRVIVMFGKKPNQNRTVL